MNVLVIGGGAWRDTSSLGNTFTNLFSDWEQTVFYNLYFRETLPKNNICDKYFNITDFSILKNFFCPQRIGGRVARESESIADALNSNRENKLISIIHKLNIKFIYDLEDYLWETGKWKNERLDTFIREAGPDIIFTFAAGNNCIVKTVEYVKMQTGAKVVTFIADDIHAEYSRLRNCRGTRNLKNLELLFSLSEKIYGISEEICEKYSILLKKNIVELKKGCNYFAPVKSVYNLPLKFVYAGNLLYGRDKVLIKVAEEIKKVNESGIKIVLEIYSGTVISDAQKEKMQIENASYFMGERPYSQLIDILTSADVTLHVESFDEEDMNLVKNSFSTKIIDCLQSGNVLMVVGPEMVSSVKYAKKISGTIVVNELSKIRTVLIELTEKTEKLLDDAISIRQFALRYHDGEKNRKKLEEQFRELVSGRK